MPPPQILRLPGDSRRIRLHVSLAGSALADDGRSAVDASASLLGVGISIPGEEGPGRRVAVLPREKARIEENWNSIGLAGTGSHDIVVEDVLVPEDWTFFWGAEPSLDVPILRYPSLPFTAQVFAAVGLGCARRAIQELTHLAVLAVAGGSRLALKDRAYVQSGLARAEASLSAARAFLHQVTDEVWNGVLGRHAVSAELGNRMRLASTHLAQISAEVARTCWEMAGSAALHPDHILSRCMQDCGVVAQHFYLSEESLEMAGRVLLGRHQPPTVQPPLQN